MAYENYVVRQFMDAWFSENYTELSLDEFKIVQSEYQDTSGLYLTEDFEKIGYIHHLNSKLNYVKLFLKVQRDFISDFDFPFERDFESFKYDYGYVLKWNKDLEDFEKQLKKVERGQVKHEDFLKQKVKELNDSRLAEKEKSKDDKEENKVESLRKSRTSFIRMWNSLGKRGYNTDKNTTTVEELSLMIKQELEESEKQ